eukprot:jgi/Ulvmu1/7373/UM036_0033.1
MATWLRLPHLTQGRTHIANSRTSTSHFTIHFEPNNSYEWRAQGLQQSSTSVQANPALCPTQQCPDERTKCYPAAGPSSSSGSSPLRNSNTAYDIKSFTCLGGCRWIAIHVAALRHPVKASEGLVRGARLTWPPSTSSTSVWAQHPLRPMNLPSNACRRLQRTWRQTCRRGSHAARCAAQHTGTLRRQSQHSAQHGSHVGLTATARSEMHDIVVGLGEPGLDAPHAVAAASNAVPAETLEEGVSLSSGTTRSGRKSMQSTAGSLPSASPTASGAAPASQHPGHRFFFGSRALWRLFWQAWLPSASLRAAFQCTAEVLAALWQGKGVAEGKLRWRPEMVGIYRCRTAGALPVGVCICWHVCDCTKWSSRPKPDTVFTGSAAHSGNAQGVTVDSTRDILEWKASSHARNRSSMLGSMALLLGSQIR